MRKMTLLRKSTKKVSNVPLQVLQRQSKPAIPLHPVLRLQQTAGNRAVGQLIQAKLKVGQPGDQYEQEADRMADQVMRMPAPQVQQQSEEKEDEELVQTKPLITPLVQRQTEEDEEEEEETFRAKRLPGRSAGVTLSLASRIHALKEGGQPLPESMRAFFEPRFGCDLSQVRAHTDMRAAQTARMVNARAFTVGQNIVFGAGQYRLETTAGRRLLAHELVHVAQQVPQGRILRTPEKPREKTVAGPSELAVPPTPTATVILVGSPTNPTKGFDKSAYNFSNAARKVVSKITAILPGTKVTILYFSPGYKLRGKNIHKKALKDLKATGATVVDVTTADQVINFLNTGLVSSAESTPTRAVKISRFFYFGHGTGTKMLLNWGWDKEFHSLSKNAIINIKTEAFEPTGESYLFTCHIAEGKNSFMSVWASHLGQTSIGPQGNAAFNAKYDASDLDKAINKKLPDWFLGLPYLNKVKIIAPKRKVAE